MLIENMYLIPPFVWNTGEHLWYLLDLIGNHVFWNTMRPSLVLIALKTCLQIQDEFCRFGQT